LHALASKLNIKWLTPAVNTLRSGLRIYRT